MPSALLAFVMAVACASAAPENAPPSFGDNFEITGAEDHVKTSPDGQTWYLYLDNKTGEYCHSFTSPQSVRRSHLRCCAGVGFQTKQRYLFGWFSMKLKLVGNDSAGVVTAYYVRSSRPSLSPPANQSTGIARSDQGLT